MQANNKRRPVFWKRKFLVNPKAQFEVIFYFSGISLISMLLLYMVLQWAFLTLLKESVGLGHLQFETVQVVHDLLKSFFQEFFAIYVIVSFTLSFFGGVFLSHRIFGSAFRVKKILESLSQGQEPETFNCRKDDFFQDLFPLLKKIALRIPRNKGFTLVEVMVVIALIGILGSVAMTQIDKFVGKARRVESKTMLSGIFLAEKVFHIENDSYTACLRQAGFVPEGNRRFYGTGIDTIQNTCGPSGTESCQIFNFSTGSRCLAAPMGIGSPLNTSDTSYSPTIAVNPAAMAVSPFILSIPNVSNVAFRLMVIGSVTSSSLVDVWTINQNREIVLVQDGL